MADGTAGASPTRQNVSLFKRELHGDKYLIHEIFDRTEKMKP